jgi:hypothetical protein
VIDELAKLVAIEPKDRKRFKRLLEESRNFASVPIRTRLTDDEVARFTAQRFRFPGVEVQARLFRQYPLGEVASHVIGYIGRINQKRSQGHRGRRGRRRQLQRHRPYRQGRPGKELRAPAARPDRLRGSRALGRRPRDPHAVAPPRHPGQQPDPVDRHRAAEGDRRSLRRPARRAGRDRARDRRRAGLCVAPRLRPQPVRRRHRRPELERTEYLARQAADEPAAVGHLSARLDLQALHGAGRAGAGQAPSGAGHQRSRLLHAGRAPLQRRQAGRPRLRSTCTARS